MKLAFSTNAYTRFSLIDALRGIKVAGYDGVEILADKPHAYPAQLEADDVKTIRDELDRLNLAVSNVNANCCFGYWSDAPPEPYFEPSLISPNPKHREDRTNLIYGALQFAHDVRAANISITSGRCLGGMPPDRAARQFAESIKPILERSDKLGDRLWNLHVEDIPDRKHYHMIPGEGSIDWSALRGALAEVRYERFLTVELYTHTQDPQTAAEKSIAFLRERFM
jgi:sugar phosphate isomerase/epimerase